MYPMIIDEEVKLNDSNIIFKYFNKKFIKKVYKFKK
jgi:hypothetical protein